ncbi:Hypothetical protein NTJ_04910 [Nesidiocoris tenuis]|uniref:Secreted protein n=1 Tax=Nesidiocoris tenuis TaxID=355587 RepID=A0ABN7ALB6_9HEMI|nr:Hypothetical protein NTJ_04910 [Nesidiocoris tenuis]
MFVHVVAFLYFAGVVLAAPSRFENEDRDGRGMTWSNFLPGGGVTFWSSATDDFWAPESDQHRRLPQNSEFDFHGAEHWPSDGKPSTPGTAVPAVGEKEKPTTTADAPPTNLRPFDDDRERRPLKPNRGSWPGKKDHSNDDEDDRKYSGANASVNAWFPIMFGMMPPPEGKTSTDKTAKDSSNYDSNNAEDLPPRSITVVANSVNHANRGRANAHSVLFAGSDPTSSFRRFGRSLILVR